MVVVLVVLRGLHPRRSGAPFLLGGGDLPIQVRSIVHYDRFLLLLPLDLRLPLDLLLPVPVVPVLLNDDDLLQFPPAQVLLVVPSMPSPSFPGCHDPLFCQSDLRGDYLKI